MSLSDSWCSPPEIADPVEEFFGGAVDVDPCSNSYSVIRAKRAYTTGGLVLPWGATTYDNFPYSQGDAWTQKMLSELACGNVREIIILSMMSTSAQWWADMCLKPRRNPRILATRRLAFIDPEAAVQGQRRQSCRFEPGQRRQSCRFEPGLTYIGPRTSRFDRTFAHLVRWSTWGR